MAHLHTSLVLLLFFCSVWPSDGMFHFTHLGTMCTGDCKLVGLVYKCESINKDGNVHLMYCSPKPNTDSKGRLCSGMCKKANKEYYWCSSDSDVSIFDLSYEFPTYCGLVTDDKIYYGSTDGALCYDNCDQIYDGYYWCNTVDGKWDYCSPSENSDYKNKQCTSLCGYWSGKNSKWCGLKNGDWGYCGLVKTKTFLRRTKEDHFCLDECQYYEKKDYYWCHTADGWDYCSPELDVTYRDKPCRSDHFCDTHGENYNWCWTSESDYDYCGPIVHPDNH